VIRTMFLLSTFATVAAAPSSIRTSAFGARLRVIEACSGGRLGAYAIDTSDGRTLAYRACERFPMCSTFKVLLVGAVLHRVDAGTERLDRRVAYEPAALLEYAPVTRANVRHGSMTVRALCAAAIALSDNTAANLLLETVGGPPGVTRFVRSLGDRETRLDRTEPSLDTAIPGDPRDTTTPRAMAHDLRAMLLGCALSGTSQRALDRWLADCKTGLTALRAGLPTTWHVGDKTGTGGAVNAIGESGTRNDVAILRPPHRSPILVTAYLTRSNFSSAANNAALAAVGRAVADIFDGARGHRDRHEVIAR